MHVVLLSIWHVEYSKMPLTKPMMTVLTINMATTAVSLKATIYSDENVLANVLNCSRRDFSQTFKNMLVCS